MIRINLLPHREETRKRRREKAGVPKEIRFQTRHELMLEMLDEHGSVLPHAWIAGDDELRALIVADALGQIVDDDLLVAGERDCALDCVVQLTDLGRSGRRCR